jgi:DNA replication protein DnaD
MNLSIIENMKIKKLISDYKKALKIAENTSGLGCHVNQINKTISELKNKRPVTVLDEVWIQYFLHMNEPQTISSDILTQAYALTLASRCCFSRK